MVEIVRDSTSISPSGNRLLTVSDQVGRRSRSPNLLTDHLHSLGSNPRDKSYGIVNRVRIVRAVATLPLLLVALAAGCVTEDCKAVLFFPHVRIVVPAEWADGTSRLKICADDECGDGLEARKELGVGVVVFVLQRALGSTVRVTIEKLSVPVAKGEGVIRTHLIDRGCSDVSVASAVFDADAGALVQSNWTFRNKSNEATPTS